MESLSSYQVFVEDIYQSHMYCRMTRVVVEIYPPSDKYVIYQSLCETESTVLYSKLHSNLWIKKDEFCAA